MEGGGGPTAQSSTAPAGVGDASCLSRLLHCCTRADEAAGQQRGEITVTRPRRPASFEAFKLCLLTLNEGDLPLNAGRIQAAASASVRGLCPEGPSAVVLARQEAHSSNLRHWDITLSALGFPHRIAGARHHELSQVHVYSRSPDSFESLFHATTTNESKKASAKGVVAVFVKHLGLNLCFASCHLDGNLLHGQRLAPVSAMIEEACRRTRGEIDAMFVMGDINCTISPTAKAQERSGGAQGAFALLEKELSLAAASPEEKGTFNISQELKDHLLRGFGTQAGREEMCVMDGCPAEIRARDELELAIGAVKLVDMPSPSFPTYRLCTASEATLQRLRDAGCGSEDPGVFFMRPSLELTPEDVDALYFLDDNKGHSGAIKKRGEMCRLGLGWLDRLYVGMRGDGGANATAEVVQGTPAFLLSEAMEALDHNLVPWVVTLRNPRS